MWHGSTSIFHQITLQRKKVQTSSSCIVTDLLSCSAVVLPHLITFSARIIITGGIVRPSALAVLRLITSSNLVGCSTGRSADLVPFRILSTKTAARLKVSA